MDLENSKQLPYVSVIRKLFAGSIYSEDKEWNMIEQYKFDLIAFFESLAIELIIQENDGYAYLKQIENENGEVAGWTKRRKLTYEQSVFCIFLRTWLLEFESSESEMTKLLMQKSDLQNRMELFFKESNNQVKLIKSFDKLIDDMEKLDFLKLVNNENKNNPVYEVRRIIKSKISIDMLSEFNKQING